jgi:hypothetical protein
MHNIKFKNWDDFKANMVKKLLTASSKSNLKSFLFRGQANSGWPLKSSFDRIEDDKSKYDQLLDNFEKICSTYSFNEELFAKGNNDKNLIAAYGQHYGLPTRLLDWTTSPYFAAFFAFSSGLSITGKSKTCSIWAINKGSESNTKEKGLDFVSLSTNKYNYRIKNQLGHFTISRHSESSINEYDIMLVTKHGKDDLLWKFDIPLMNVEEVLEDLETMGIIHSIAYPDIQGYIEEAVYKTGLIK